MTKELQDYLLKCVLEELENKAAPEDAQELCSCRLGLVDTTIVTTTYPTIQGE